MRTILDAPSDRDYCGDNPADETELCRKCNDYPCQCIANEMAEEDECSPE